MHQVTLQQRRSLICKDATTASLAIVSLPCALVAFSATTTSSSSITRSGFSEPAEEACKSTTAATANTTRGSVVRQHGSLLLELSLHLLLLQELQLLLL